MKKWLALLLSAMLALLALGASAQEQLADAY